MKKFLVMDTSSNYLTVIAQGEERQIEYVPNCAGSHSVQLMPCVEATLQRANLTARDCDFFAVVVGAGSFTGIRIGISTVKGLCTGTGKKALPVTSFECIAYTTGEKATLAVISAGHGFVYLCGFDKDKKVVEPPSYRSLQEAEELLKEYEVAAGFEDIPLPRFEKVDMSNGLYSAVTHKMQWEENLISAERLQALYVRKSQAEENRK